MGKDNKYLYGGILIVRILIGCVLVTNYSHPDQYWQGPEIAHKFVYGYGHETWEWTMAQPIRSPIYPIFLSLGYSLIKAIHLDSDTMVTLIPWIFNSIISTICDIFVLKMIQSLYGQVSITIKLCVLTNWFYLSTMSRTYINGLETSLVVVAYYFWMFRHSRSYNDLASRVLVGICYLARPTSILFWAVVWPYQLLTLKKGHIRFIVKNLLQILIMVGLSAIVAYLWYGKLQLTELNFFKYNVMLGWSSYYGQNNFLDYLTMYIPIIIPLHLYSLLWSMWRIMRWKKVDKQQGNIMEDSNMHRLRELLIISLVGLLLLSTSKHKQPRFILLLIPLWLIISVTHLKNTHFKILWGIILLNLLLFVIINSYGKDGGREALQALRVQLKDGDHRSIIVMGAPHDIPLYSILHRNVTVTIPDTSAIKRVQNTDQQLLLVNHPQKLYQILLARNNRQPHYIIAQGKYLKFTHKVIQKHNYTRVKQWSNSNIFQRIFTQSDTIILFQKA